MSVRPSSLPADSERACALHDRFAFFVRESNRIEGILREPTLEELAEHARFLVEPLDIDSLEKFVSVVQPGAILRNKRGLNVRVSNHIAPRGGPHIEDTLAFIIEDAMTKPDPYNVHCAYEDLHPFTDGNGRSGRVLWLWMMKHWANMRDMDIALRLGFLHLFYYQTLEKSRCKAIESGWP